MLHPRRNEKVEMGSTWKCNLGCIYYKYIPGVYLPSDNNEMQSLRFLPGRNRQTPPLVGKRTVKDVETDGRQITKSRRWDSCHVTSANLKALVWFQWKCYEFDLCFRNWAAHSNRLHSLANDCNMQIFVAGRSSAPTLFWCRHTHTHTQVEVIPPTGIFVRPSNFQVKRNSRQIFVFEKK